MSDGHAAAAGGRGVAVGIGVGAGKREGGLAHASDRAREGSDAAHAPAELLLDLDVKQFALPGVEPASNSRFCWSASRWSRRSSSSLSRRTFSVCSRLAPAQPANQAGFSSVKKTC